MKITRSTQTLILASDGRGSSALIPAASEAGAAGSVVSRVTIVATQPDAGVVYLRADYSPDVSSASTAVAVRPQTANVVTSAARNSAKTSLSRTSSVSYLNLKPVELYAFTQRILTAAPMFQYIDEYA